MSRNPCFSALIASSRETESGNLPAGSRASPATTKTSVAPIVVRIARISFRRDSSRISLAERWGTTMKPCPASRVARSMVASMPRRGDAVIVIVTSRGTLATTRSSTSSVGRTSYRGERRKATRAFLLASSIRPNRRDAASAIVTTTASSRHPHETCRTIWYCRAPRNGASFRLQAPERKWRPKGKDHVPILGPAGPAGGEPRERRIPRQLAMQPGEVLRVRLAGRVRPIVVHHRAGDRDRLVAGVEDLDQASLARPVHQRGGGDLPEATGNAKGVGARAYPVGMDVPVQPQDHVVEPVQQLKQIVRRDKRGALDSWMCSGVGQRVEAVVRKDHHQPILVRRFHVQAMSGLEFRVNLLACPLEPADLVGADTPVSASGGTRGVEGDEAYGRSVENVVRGPVLLVLRCEAVPARPRAKSKMRVDEAVAPERAPRAVSSHVDGGTGHEGLRPVDESLQRRVAIE